MSQVQGTQQMHDEFAEANDATARIPIRSDQPKLIEGGKDSQTLQKLHRSFIQGSTRLTSGSVGKIFPSNKGGDILREPVVSFSGVTSLQEDDQSSVAETSRRIKRGARGGSRGGGGGGGSSGGGGRASSSGGSKSSSSGGSKSSSSGSGKSSSSGSGKSSSSRGGKSSSSQGGSSGGGHTGVGCCGASAPIHVRKSMTPPSVTSTPTTAPPRVTDGRKSESSQEKSEKPRKPKESADEKIEKRGRLGNRVAGAFMAAGGILEGFAGKALIASRTPFGTAAGVGLVGHGGDLTAAGLRQMWTGQTAQSFTAQAISRGLQSVGVKPGTAGTIAGLTEVGIAGVPIGIVGKAGAIAAKGTRGLVNVTSGSRTIDSAITTAEKWLKPGYSELGNPGSGVYRSADGLRQFRMSATDISGSHGKIGPHVHFEKFDLTGVTLKNIHTPLIVP